MCDPHILQFSNGEPACRLQCAKYTHVSFPRVSFSFTHCNNLSWKALCQGWQIKRDKSMIKVHNKYQYNITNLWSHCIVVSSSVEWATKFGDLPCCFVNSYNVTGNEPSLKNNCSFWTRTVNVWKKLARTWLVILHILPLAVMYIWGVEICDYHLGRKNNFHRVTENSRTRLLWSPLVSKRPLLFRKRGQWVPLEKIQEEQRCSNHFLFFLWGQFTTHW